VPGVFIAANEKMFGAVGRQKRRVRKLTRLKVPADAQGECGEDQVAGCLENAGSDQWFPRLA
jgi:hypothetical protein